MQHAQLYQTAHPSPATRLMCCDMCGRSQWVVAGASPVPCCQHCCWPVLPVEQEEAVANIRQALAGFAPVPRAMRAQKSDV